MNPKFSLSSISSFTTLDEVHFHIFPFLLNKIIIIIITKLEGNFEELYFIFMVFSWEDYSVNARRDLNCLNVKKNKKFIFLT